MTQILRQSTQVVVRIGPAVAVGDGFTPVTGLTLSGADEAELLKAAGAATVSIAGNTFAAISGADGWYDLTLSTTDTNTIGTLDVVVNDDSLILPIFARFQVIEEAAYDAMYAASAAPPSAAAIADAVWDEDATAHQTQGTFGQAIGDPAADTNSIYKAVVTDAAGATVGVDIVAVKAETAAILADTAEIGAAGAGLTAINLPDQAMNITGNITGNLSGSVGSVTGAVGSVTGLTPATVHSDLDDIQAKIGTPANLGGGATLAGNLSDIESQTDDIGVAGAGLTALASAAAVADLPTNAELATALAAADDAVLAAVAAVQADTDNIQTRLPAALSAGGNMKSDVKEVNDVALEGDGAGTPWGPA